MLHEHVFIGRHRDIQTDGFTPLTSHRWRPRSKNTQQPDPCTLTPISLPRRAWEQKHPRCPCINHLHMAFLPHSSSSTFSSSRLVSLTAQRTSTQWDIVWIRCARSSSAEVTEKFTACKGHSSVYAFGNPFHQGLSLALCSVGSV